MPNAVATGASTAPTAASAASEAVAAAVAGLSGRAPSFGFLFASPRLPLQECLGEARRRLPGTDLVGCTTAGEITERGRTDGGVALLLVSSDGMEHTVRWARHLERAPARAVTDLCAGFSERREAARARGLGVSTSVLLVDALTGAGELVVDGLHQSMGALHEIVGGAAGDEGRFTGTYVGSGAQAATDSAAVIDVFGRNRWGVGVDHGLTPATPPMRVTRAKANVVYEIDGRPAYQVYEEFARKRGVRLERATAPAFFIQNELGLLVFDTLKKARAPLAVGPDGSLTCAAQIPQGAAVCILGGTRDALVDAATRAAKEAKERLGGKPAAGVLLFDCICRGGILGEEFGREIGAIRSVFPGVPIGGFLTYGEIARYSGRLDGWHNTTAVVAAIPA
jgi:hypothetical protein